MGKSILATSHVGGRPHIVYGTELSNVVRSFMK